MSKINQILTIRAQVASFFEIGFQVYLKNGIGISPIVIIKKGHKTYKFSDPDCDIIIKQLSTLYRKVNVTNKQ